MQTAETCLAFLFGMAPFTPSDQSELLQFFGSWHVVHFIFSGTEWDRDLPQGFILGGQDWLQWDAETEPMRILPPLQVQEVNKFLAADRSEQINRGLLKLSGSPNDIYHGNIAESEFAGIHDQIVILREFVATAAQNAQAIVMDIG